MATYSQFKKIATDSIVDNTIPPSKFATDVNDNYGIVWVFNERGFCCNACSAAGDCTEQANGKCCQWTVPTGVTKAIFEIWSGGGSGAGSLCCCCYQAIGGAGGNYAQKTINVLPGWQYTVCAGGTFPCRYVRACTGGQGCASFVTGCNLSNFCAVGGCGAWACQSGDAWSPYIITSCSNCGIGGSTCGFAGADFGMMGTTGGYTGRGLCHCYKRTQFAGTAPIVGKVHLSSAMDVPCQCGCFINWPAGGGMSGNFGYIGNFGLCCAAGTMGGSGLVKITYV